MRRVLVALVALVCVGGLSAAGLLAGIRPALAHLGPSEALPGLSEYVDSVSTVRLTFPLELEAGAEHKLLLSDAEGNLFEMSPTVQVNDTTIEARLMEELPEPGPYIVRYTAWEAHEAGETASFSDGGYQFVYDPFGNLRNAGSPTDDAVGTGVMIGVGVGVPLLLLGLYVVVQSRRAG